MATEDEAPEAAAAASLAMKSLERDDKIRSDAKRLKRILKMDPEDLCRKQNECKG